MDSDSSASEASSDDVFPSDSPGDSDSDSPEEDEIDNLSQQLSQINSQDDGVESDNDKSGVYHWSRQQEETEVIAQDPLMQPNRRPFLALWS